MDFDKYLKTYYGFTTEDKKWKRMTAKAKRILRESHKMDTEKEEEGTKLATLYPEMAKAGQKSARSAESAKTLLNTED